MPVAWQASFRHPPPTPARLRPGGAGRGGRLPPHAAMDLHRSR